MVSYLSCKISKTVTKSQLLPTRNNVISVKVGRNVNLFFIFTYIEKTNEVPDKTNWFCYQNHTSSEHNVLQRMYYIRCSPEGATCILRLNDTFSGLVYVLFQKYVSVGIIHSNAGCPARLCHWTAALFTVRSAYWRHYSSPWTILPSLCL